MRYIICEGILLSRPRFHDAQAFSVACGHARLQWRSRALFCLFHAGISLLACHLVPFRLTGYRRPSIYGMPYLVFFNPLLLKISSGRIQACSVCFPGFPSVFSLHLSAALRLWRLPCDLRGCSLQPFSLSETIFLGWHLVATRCVSWSSCLRMPSYRAAIL